MMKIFKFCFSQNTPERLLYSMKKIESSFKNKISRVEHTDTHTDRHTDRHPDRPPQNFINIDILFDGH